MTPVLPSAWAVSFSVTTSSTSPVSPTWIAMAPLLLPDRDRVVNPQRASLRRPDDELNPEDDEERFEDAEEGLLAHAVEEAAPEPRAANHDHADIEADQHERAGQQLGAAEHHRPRDIGADGAEGVGGQVAPPAEAVAQKERRHDGADRADQSREEAEDRADQREVIEPHGHAAVGEQATKRHGQDHEGAHHAREPHAVDARVERGPEHRRRHGADEKQDDDAPHDVVPAEPDARAVADQHADGQDGDRRLDAHAPRDGGNHDDAGAEARDAADRGADDASRAQDEPAGHLAHDALVYSTPCRSSWRRPVSCSSGSTARSTSPSPPWRRPSASARRPCAGSSFTTSGRMP